MNWRFRVGKAGRLAPFLAVAATLGACSGASMSKSAETLGYGTPGVSAYGQDGEDESLQAMLARCNGVPQASAASEVRGLPAACAQLRRTLRNQPGNAVQPGREL